MPSYNKVIVAGHLTRDPELKYTTAGTAAATIGIAVNESWTTKDGQRKEEAHFFDVVCFGKTAENVGKHLTKGRSMLVEGRLKQDRWEDKESGQKRSAVRILADRIVFLGGGKPDDRKDAPENSDDIPY